MSKTLYTSTGIAVAIGREIGKGGEGSVFEVPSHVNQVAKIYHNNKLPDQKKQAKLRFMAAAVDVQLTNYIAWPQDTLHTHPNGPVIGFLMPKVSGKEPVHMVYSPAHRRQDNPKAAWDFLLFVARNIAAAFETVHACGHVIGDVNQNSFMVGKDSKVVLIDSDSFQVNAGGTLHLCEVGVAHFTPPELQSLPSFSGFARTANHDNFGLALLIFHVLFGGRHPFSGVPLRDGVGDALETDIKNFRYAYARDNQTRGFRPPPNAIPVSMLPDVVESMFQLAFTEKGANGGRPSAHQWVTALDGLRTRLQKCGVSSMHVYPDHLGVCPWCALEKQGVVYFVDLGATFTPTSSGFVLTQVWGVIQAVQPPEKIRFPQPENFVFSPQPLPSEIAGKGTIFFYRFLVIVVAVTLATTFSKISLLFLLMGLIGWVVAGSAGSSEREMERSKRLALKQAAKQEYDQLIARAREVGPEGFHNRRAEFAKIKAELEQLPKLENDELDALQLTAQARQKQKFLENFFIDNAEISGVGPARKAALRSFGIETAADINRSRVKQVHGFGESLTRAMMDWKARCERRFVFNPALAVSSSDKDAVRAKFSVKRIALEKSLSAAPSELHQYRQRAASTLSTLLPAIEAASKKLAQAEADLSVF